MSQSLPRDIRTETADAAVTEFTFAKITSTGIATATAATDKIIGVFQATAATGEKVAYAAGGTVKVKLGGTVTKGAYLTATTAGAAIATTTAGDTVAAVALEAGVSGDIAEASLVFFKLS